MLLVRRHARANFAAGVYVFPGGAVETEDCGAEALKLSAGLSPAEAQAVIEDDQPADRALGIFVAAIRETFEEVGILLACMADGTRWMPDPTETDALAAVREEIYRGDLDFASWVRGRNLRLATGELVYFAHWITPEIRPRRFDTRFFLAEVAPGVDARPDDREVFDHVWISPREAGGLQEAGELRLMTPTLRNLELLAPFATTAEALAGLRNTSVQTILPKVEVMPGGATRILHPGDADYESVQ